MHDCPDVQMPEFYYYMAVQELAQLLYQLKTGGHKALIFTQMTKMLDVLEAFLNLHGYTYLRLDGTTKPEQRQASSGITCLMLASISEAQALHSCMFQHTMWLMQCCQGVLKVGQPLPGCVPNHYS